MEFEFEQIDRGHQRAKVQGHKCPRCGDFGGRLELQPMDGNLWQGKYQCNRCFYAFTKGDIEARIKRGELT